MRSLQAGPVLDYFKPTAWKMITVILLYASNYFFFLGIYINFPVNYIYWNSPPETELQKALVFAVHVAYLYILACVLTHVFGEKTGVRPKRSRRRL